MGITLKKYIDLTFQSNTREITTTGTVQIDQLTWEGRRKVSENLYHMKKHGGRIVVKIDHPQLLTEVAIEHPRLHVENPEAITHFHRETEGDETLCWAVLSVILGYNKRIWELAKVVDDGIEEFDVKMDNLKEKMDELAHKLFGPPCPQCKIGIMDAGGKCTNCGHEDDHYKFDEFDTFQ